MKQIDKESLSKMNVDLLEIILEETQARHDETMKTFEDNRRRSKELFQYLLPILAGLLVYIPEIKNVNHALAVELSLAALITLLICMWNGYIYWYIKMKTKGLEIRNYSKENFEYFNMDGDQVQRFIVHLIVSYIDKIDHNSEKNKVLSENIKIITRTVFFLGFVFTTIYLYVTIIS